jgi:NAD(P)-dependent dehydrogenase (short-subunit alcohol dehydrogenase family)
MADLMHRREREILGRTVYAKLEEVSDEDHEQVFKTNYWGVVYGTLEALKHLKQKGGVIINQGSIVSDMPAPILGAYVATDEPGSTVHHRERSRTRQ